MGKKPFYAEKDGMQTYICATNGDRVLTMEYCDRAHDDMAKAVCDRLNGIDDPRSIPKIFY